MYINIHIHTVDPSFELNKLKLKLQSHAVVDNLFLESADKRELLIYKSIQVNKLAGYKH